MPYFIGIVAALAYLGLDDVDWTPVIVVAVLVVLGLALAGSGSRRSRRRPSRPTLEEYDPRWW
jgi:hypothetical protein